MLRSLSSFSPDFASDFQGHAHLGVARGWFVAAFDKGAAGIRGSETGPSAFELEAVRLATPVAERATLRFIPVEGDPKMA